MNTENVIYTHNRIPSNHEKEVNSVIYDNVGQSGGHYFKQTNTGMKRQISQDLFLMWDFSKTDLTEIECRMVVPRG
jgi:hypothetical protein